MLVIDGQIKEPVLAGRPNHGPACRCYIPAGPAPRSQLLRHAESQTRLERSAATTAADRECPAGTSGFALG